MRDEQGNEPAPNPGGPRRRGGFNFNLSFGRKPPITGRAADPDDSSSTEDVREFRIEFADGKLRVKDGDVTDSPPEEAPDAEAEMWERLGRVGTGAYPDTARLHRALRTVVMLLGLAVPVALCVVGLATGQSGETVVFMTLGGLIVGAMFISSFPGRR